MRGLGGISRLGAIALSVLAAASAATGQTPEARAARGERLFMEHGCYGCHTVGKVGTPIAPDLSRVGARYSEAYLAAWLRDPSVQKPTAHMPRIGLSDADARDLAAYLSSLR